MNKVMTLQQYSQAYKVQNPHDKVDAPSEIRWPVESILPLIIGLVAVNILSASHTAPVIAQSVPTTIEGIKIAVGIAGFFGVEFLMFSANFVARSKTGGWQRNLLILLALSVAIVANVGSVVGAIAIKDDIVSLVSGGLIGIFAPIANFVTGEMLRKVLDQTKEERVKAKAEYKQALIDYDTKMRQRFVLYLKRQGITDATQILKLSSGEAVEVAEVAVPKPATIEPTTKDYSYPPRITELVDKLRANGDTELGYKAIQEKYGVYPADISKAKQMLKN
jgi:hypothetical protein